MRAVYVVPSGATTSNRRPRKTSGRVGPRSSSPPRLYLAHDHPPRSHESGDDGRKRFVITNPDIRESMTASRPQDVPALDGPSDHPYSRISRMSPPTRALPSPPGRYLQHPVHPTSSERGFEESLYLTIVRRPSMEAPPGMLSGGSKGPKHYVSNGSPLKEHRRSTSDRMRESWAEEDHRVDPDYVSKAQEGGWDARYSDLFERQIATILETGSVNRSRPPTPFSDQSSILVPRRTSPEALLSMARKTQNRRTNSQLVGIPHIPSTKPTSQPRPRAKEELLHCDELDFPPHKPLSRMEKAILRRIEFGQHVDFSTIQLS